MALRSFAMEEIPMADNATSPPLASPRGLDWLSVRWWQALRSLDAGSLLGNAVAVVALLITSKQGAGLLPPPPPPAAGGGASRSPAAPGVTAPPVPQSRLCTSPPSAPFPSTTPPSPTRTREGRGHSSPLAPAAPPRPPAAVPANPARRLFSHRPDTIPYWCTVVFPLAALALTAAASELWLGARQHGDATGAVAACLHFLLEGISAVVLTGLYTSVRLPGKAGGVVGGGAMRCGG